MAKSRQTYRLLNIGAIFDPIIVQQSSAMRVIRNAKSIQRHPIPEFRVFFGCPGSPALKSQLLALATKVRTRSNFSNYCSGLRSIGSASIPWRLRLRRCLGLLFLPFLGLSQLLSGNNAVVFCFNLFAVMGNLVALLGLRPEARNGETVVEVRAEIIHDADWEHDIHAELDQRGWRVSVGPCV